MSGLKRDKDNWKIIFSFSDDCSYITSPSFIITDLNKSMKNLLGEDKTGQLCYKAIYQRDSRCEWCIYDRLIEAKHISYEMQNPINKKHYKVENILLNDNFKFTSYKDISDLVELVDKQRQVNEELHISNIKINRKNNELLLAKQRSEENEERFRSLYENSTIGLYRTTPKGEILLANPALLGMLGYKSLEDIKSINVVDAGYVNPNDRRSFQSSIEKNGVVYGFESEWKKKNGESIFVRESAKSIKDQKGRIIYYEGTVEDVTDRYIAEENLKKSEEKYRNFYENTPIMLHSIDYNGVIISASNYWLKVMGYSKEEVIGVKSTEFLTEDSKRYANEIVLPDFFKKGFCYDVPYQFVKKNGEIIDVLLSAVSEKDNKGNVTSSQAVIVDITQRKIAENKINLVNEQLSALNKEYHNILKEVNLQNKELKKARIKAEESDRLKSAFLSNMSHEIRTPLNSILGFSQLLTMGKISQEQQTKFYKHIHDSGKHLLNLLNDVLEISKIEAGLSKYFENKCNINEMLIELQNTFVAYMNEIGKKNISISINSELTDDEAYILTDELKLQQIFRNLINNSIKFTERGEISIGCKLNSDKTAIHCYVSDTGMGIDKSNHKIIFNRFKQLDETSTREYEGSGLGLYICKECTDMLRGRIWVESEKGKGSTFFFEFPYKNIYSVEKEDVAKTANIVIPNEVLKKNKLLVVEDNHSSYLFIKTILDNIKLKHIRAENGEQAIELCQSHLDITLVLMDIHLPIINGIEATKMIKKMKTDLPIIAQTAYAFEEDQKKFIAAGGDDYILKPINSHELISKTLLYLKN